MERGFSQDLAIQIVMGKTITASLKVESSNFCHASLRHFSTSATFKLSGHQHSEFPSQVILRVIAHIS